MSAFNPARPLALALCLTAAPALAQSSFDPVTNVLRVIGITPSEREAIEYRERPPLVVPPNTGKLRSPEEAAADRNPKWPQDPDVLAKRRRAEEARQPLARDRRYDPNELAGVTLETGRERSRYAGVPTAGTYEQSPGTREAPANLTPEQVRSALATRDGDKPLKPGEEPRRQYLTEPPTGYRKAAAGAPVKATMDPLNVDDKVEIDILRSQRQQR